VPETRAAQAEMAREYGIEAFCYYHYWFGGKRILERPFNEVLQSGQPDFPFCLCWANQTWTGIWHGNPDRVLIEQIYPGYGDHQAHFKILLQAFTDERYLKIDGKPIFLIYRPKELPESNNVIEFWKESAVKAGLKGLCVIGVSEQPEWNPNDCGFDASIVQRLPSNKKWVSKRHPPKWLINKYHQITQKPAIYSYKNDLPEAIAPSDGGIIKYPCILPNWDNTPRCGKEGMVLHESTPELFRINLGKLLKATKRISSEHNLIFIKSWNEWAEGNHLEPDHRFGKGYLLVIKEEVLNNT
jgi:lipopolysaccharide biosynthesis protein